MTHKQVDMYYKYGSAFSGKLLVVEYLEDCQKDKRWGDFNAGVSWEYLAKAHAFVKENYGDYDELMAMPELVVRLKQGCVFMRRLNIPCSYCFGNNTKVKDRRINKDGIIKRTCVCVDCEKSFSIVMDGANRKDTSRTRNIKSSLRIKHTIYYFKDTYKLKSGHELRGLLLFLEGLAYLFLGRPLVGNLPSNVFDVKLPTMFNPELFDDDELALISRASTYAAALKKDYINR